MGMVVRWLVLVVTPGTIISSARMDNIRNNINSIINSSNIISIINSRRMTKIKIGNSNQPPSNLKEGSLPRVNSIHSTSLPKLAEMPTTATTTTTATATATTNYTEEGRWEVSPVTFRLLRN